jgi:hypothetical protein
MLLLLRCSKRKGSQSMSISRCRGTLLLRLLCTVLLSAAFALSQAQAQALPKLPALGLDPQAVTVSGLSSGAYMAEQFSVIYSSALAGTAEIAGGPYGCARGSVSNAMYKCSCPLREGLLAEWLGLLPGLSCQVLDADTYAGIGELATERSRPFIDDPAHLRRHRVYLFSGGQDKVVAPPLVKAVERYYRHFGVPAAQIRHVERADAGHGMPTLSNGSCSLTAPPFLTGCQFDAAGDLLKWLYDRPAWQPATPVAGALRRFDQRPYADTRYNGLDDSGWLYVPPACESGGAACKLHVVFHGCDQAQSFGAPGPRFGSQFVEGAGYNRWAEGGRVVLLYPQVKPSPAGALYNPFNAYQFNPKGCWDFWGYTDPLGASVNGSQPSYARRTSPQAQSVKRMVDALLSRP